MPAKKKSTSPSTVVSPQSQRRSAAPKAPPLAPQHLAFVGDSEGAQSGAPQPDDAVRVQALCWATIPTAWAFLTQTWDAMTAHRVPNSAPIKARGLPCQPDWVAETVPKLSAPFSDVTATESTLAALIARAPIELALSIGEIPSGTPLGLSRGMREVAIACLNDYLENLKTPGRSACRVLLSISRGEQRDRELSSAYRDAWERAEASHLDRAELRFCDPSDAPVPLDLTNLAAVATARYLSMPEVANPVFEALRSKVVRMPRHLVAPTPRKRR